MQHDDLNEMLKARATPRAPADLAERIIFAANAQTQTKLGTSSLWNELLSMFVLPHPSVAVVTGILLGLALGVQASDGLTVLQQDWSSFLDINEGGWL